MSDLWRYSPERCDGDFCPGNCDHCNLEEDDDEVSAVRHGSDESDRQPTIEERKKGEWEPIGSDSWKGYRCLVCKSTVEEVTPYCPWCGADMER